MVKIEISYSVAKPTNYSRDIGLTKQRIIRLRGRSSHCDGIIRRYLAVTSFLPSPRSRGSPDATFKSLAAAISFRRYKLHRSSTNTIHGCTPSFLVVESGCLKKAQGHVHCGWWLRRFQQLAL